MDNPDFNRHIEKHLQSLSNKKIKILDFISVHGGDINQCYKINTNEGFLFIKLNDADSYPGMFEAEAEGLNLLRNNSNFAIPKVLINGVYKNKSYLLLEYLSFERNGDWGLFGKKLAHLHQQSEAMFGLSYDNYIGSLVQSNVQKDNWADFYIQERLLPLFKKAFDLGSLDEVDLNSLERLFTEMPSIYPEEKPSLQHGDLWSGNTAFFNAIPSIFDPAVYYGHREMDIAMTQLFGGFPKTMYDAYNSIFPLEKSWRSRIEISQLYPLLVHVVLFGGGYIRQVKEILKRY